MINLAQDYIQQGWNEGNNLNNTFLLEDKVKILMDALNLFADNKLMSSAHERRHKAEAFINEANQRINVAKEFHLMTVSE